MICCVRERPIRREGSHSHDNSVLTTCPWIWWVTSPGESTYVRRRQRTLRLVAGRARRSLSWTPLGRRRSHMEHSMLTPPPEGQRKALALLASWEDIKAVRYVSIAQRALI